MSEESKVPENPKQTEATRPREGARKIPGPDKFKVKVGSFTLPVEKWSRVGVGVGCCGVCWGFVCGGLSCSLRTPRQKQP